MATFLSQVPMVTFLSQVLMATFLSQVLMATFLSKGNISYPRNSWQHFLSQVLMATFLIPGTHGSVYTNMQSAGLYPASGDSADWVYEAGGVTHSYTFELRDTGKHGFLLPQEQVL